jgi:hypothetical protein
MIQRRHAEAYVRQAYQVPALPCARDLLAYLSDAGAPWAVAPSGRAETARRTVKGAAVAIRQFCANTVPSPRSAGLESVLASGLEFGDGGYTPFRPRSTLLLEKTSGSTGRSQSRSILANQYFTMYRAARPKTSAHSES